MVGYPQSIRPVLNSIEGVFSALDTLSDHLKSAHFLDFLDLFPTEMVVLHLHTVVEQAASTFALQLGSLLFRVLLEGPHLQVARDRELVSEISVSLSQDLGVASEGYGFEACLSDSRPHVVVYFRKFRAVKLEDLETIRSVRGCIFR
jgi:hypothetical protein